MNEGFDLDEEQLLKLLLKIDLDRKLIDIDSNSNYLMKLDLLSKENKLIFLRRRGIRGKIKLKKKKKKQLKYPSKIDWFSLFA